MKKLVLSTVSLAIFLFVGMTAYSLTTNIPTPPQEKTSQGITYVVMVDAPDNMELCHSYFVSIRDMNGNYVVPPIAYDEGITNYIFHENGPITGGRVAHLEKIHTASNLICPQNVYTAPDSKFQRFSNTTTYMFNLYPIVIPGDD